MKPAQPNTGNDEGVVRSADILGFECLTLGAPLCKAVAKNDVQRLRDLLCRGHDPNERNEDGKTPLHLAAELGHTQFAKILVLSGANIEARAGDVDYTPLLAAANSNQTAAAMALVEIGADVNAVGAHGATALEIATRNNDVRLMLALIKRGAVVDSRSANGWTPLHVAAGLNKPVAIAVLVKHGANTNNRDDDGDTPLITACSLGYIDCVQQLLAGGADPAILADVRVFVDIELYLIHIDLQTGETVLHIACDLGLEEIASLLIAQGAPLSIRNAARRTARSIAQKGGYNDIVAMIDHALGRGTLV